MDDRTKKAALQAIHQLLAIVDQADAGKLPAPEGGHGDEADKNPMPEGDKPGEDMEASGGKGGAMDEGSPEEEASESPDEEAAEGDDDSSDDDLEAMTKPENGHGPEIARTVAMLRLKKKGC